MLKNAYEKIFPSAALCPPFFGCVFLSSKKILIYANSNIQVDESQKNITVEDGTTQVEKELNFNTRDPVVLNITGPGGNTRWKLKEDGLLARKSEIGYGCGKHAAYRGVKQTRITQEQLKSQLDSFNKLVKGENISAAAKNYFIPPGKIVKISDFTNAKIFGPFTARPVRI